MGLFTRLLEWIRGSAEPASESETENTEESPDTPRLDPENVTEVRTTTDSDAVNRLQNLQQSATDSDDSEQSTRD